MLTSLGVAPSTTTFVILGCAVVLFVWNRIPVEMVAVFAALALFATGVVTLNQALAGFGDPIVPFLASLFVVSEALDATGVTTWAGQQLIARVGNSQTRLVVFTMLLAAVLAALIVPNGAVAALVPMTVVLAVGLGRSPSALLMPMAFGAHAGSLLLLTGTPINVIVSEAAAEAGVGAFGFFEYALVGVPLVVGTIVIVVLFGPRLLPERTPNSIPPNLSDYARTMLKHYSLPEGQVRLRVERGSPLVGMDRAALDLSTYPGVTLAGVHAGGGGRPSGERFLVDDVLVVQGDTKSIRRLADTAILAPSTDVAAAPFEGTTTLMSGEVGVAELVVRPRSAAIGMPVFPGMVTSSGDLVILAIQRQGEDLRPEDGGLAAGDTLLVQGTWAALEANKDDADVLVVDSPEIVRAQAIPLGPGAGRTIGVLLAMVLLLALGVVPPAVAGLLAACGLVLLRVRTMTQAYRAINWTVVVLVGGMIPLSHALQDTGAADQIVQALGHVVGEAGPYPLLIGLLLVCAILGQLISNTATALVVIPITVSAAAAFGVSARPMLMAVNVVCAAALLTPVATPGNLMVMGPGGYKFGDYWKLGLPILIWYMLVAVLWVPLIWRF